MLSHLDHVSIREFVRGASQMSQSWGFEGQIKHMGVLMLEWITAPSVCNQTQLGGDESHSETSHTPCLCHTRKHLLSFGSEHIKKHTPLPMDQTAVHTDNLVSIVNCKPFAPFLGVLFSFLKEQAQFTYTARNVFLDVPSLAIPFLF